MNAAPTATPTSTPLVRRWCGLAVCLSLAATWASPLEAVDRTTEEYDIRFLVEPVRQPEAAPWSGIDLAKGRSIRDELPEIDFGDEPWGVFSASEIELLIRHNIAEDSWSNQRNSLEVDVETGVLTIRRPDMSQARPSRPSKTPSDWSSTISISCFARSTGGGRGSTPSDSCRRSPSRSTRTHGPTGAPS